MSDVAARGRIGPNAVIRLVEALDAVESRAVTTRLFRSADLEPYVVKPPEAMIPEEEVTVLHRRLRSEMGLSHAASVSWIAGLRTADYLLANRIPKPVQRVLKLLPARLAAIVLLKAIGRNAWTFAGSARFSWKGGVPIVVSFEDCPLCRYDRSAAPCCQYYAATFEGLFRELIDSDAKVTETSCIAAGSNACRFEIRW
jgi:divinyl protochlorophyllide a 8-vinyl-reductase